MSASTPTGRGAMTWPQMVAMAFGAVYTLIGLIGFFITGFENFFGNAAEPGVHHAGDTLLGFLINPAHNVVHLLIGIAGLVLARTLSGARTYGLLLAAGYGLAFLYGLFAVGQSWDFLNLNWADNILHLVTAIVGVVIVMGAKKVADTHNTRV